LRYFAKVHASIDESLQKIRVCHERRLTLCLQLCTVPYRIADVEPRADPEMGSTIRSGQIGT
jgi:hypothetical protein